MQSTLARSDVVDAPANNLPPAHVALYESWYLSHHHARPTLRAIVAEKRLAVYPVADLLQAYLPYWYAPQETYFVNGVGGASWQDDGDELRIVRGLVVEALSWHDESLRIASDFATFAATLPPDVAHTLTTEIFVPATQCHPPTALDSDEYGLFTADLYAAAQGNLILSRPAYLQQRLKLADPPLSTSQATLATVLARNWLGTLPGLLATVRDLDESIVLEVAP
jgi:hypothetical protein